MNYKIINNLIYSLILFSGCSFYSFKGSLPENIKSVYIHQINNDTSEYVITNLLNESIRDRLINQNLLNIVDEYNSDSQLILKIKSVDDLPNVYNNLNEKYEIVEQWKLNIKVKIIWKDIYSDKILIDKDISEWAMYDNSGIDVGMDQIDNDLDGLLDAEDSDEYGSSREAALRIV